MPRRDDIHKVLIIGSGGAGLFAALKLAPHPVVLISPEPLGEGASSAWAQGGIAAAISEGDTPQAHAADTIKAGAGLVDEPMAHLLASEAADRIEDLLRLCQLVILCQLQSPLQCLALHVHQRQPTHGLRRGGGPDLPALLVRHHVLQDHGGSFSNPSLRAANDPWEVRAPEESVAQRH